MEGRRLSEQQHRESRALDERRDRKKKASRSRIRIAEWKEPPIEGKTWGVVDDYEPQMFWAPILGPTSFSMWRLICFDLETIEGEFVIETDQYGSWIGLSDGVVTRKALDRLISFGVAYADRGRFHIRTRIGVPPDRHRQACWPRALHDLGADWYNIDKQ